METGSTENSKQIQWTVLTLFPEVIQTVLQYGVISRAIRDGKIKLNIIQIRDHGVLPHRKVDSYPFGGGAGMLIRPDVLEAAWQSAKAITPDAQTILMSPQGCVLNHATAISFSIEKELIIVCGHYEGVDQRFIDQCVDLEISIGDYVLTGGEIPALAFLDCIGRLVPGVLGNPESPVTDSFVDGKLKYPQFTKPRVWNGIEVPEILFSGDHKKIADWRNKASIEKTIQRRPDLEVESQA